MNKIKTIFFIAVLLTINSNIFAGNTGKISGKVSDEDTNEPLVGVNVIIKGKAQGASTDEQGEFYLIGIPPGKYDLEISYI